MLKRYVQIPLGYSDPAKTPLSFTVKGGSQTYDVKLEPLPGQGEKKP